MEKTIEILNNLVTEFGIAAWIGFAVVAFLLVCIAIACAWHGIKFLIVGLLPGMVKVGGFCFTGLVIIGLLAMIGMISSNEDVKDAMEEFEEREAIEMIEEGRAPKAIINE